MANFFPPHLTISQTLSYEILKLDHFLRKHFEFQALLASVWTLHPLIDPMADTDSLLSIMTASHGLSVSAAWELTDGPEGDIHEETFRKTMREAVNKMLQDFGGPENYLRSRFGTQEEMIAWLNYLVDKVPLDCAEFNFSENMPPSALDSMSKDSHSLVSKPHGFQSG